MKSLMEDAAEIIEKSIRSVLPEEAVEKALEGKNFPGGVILVSVGKAAWRMAAAAKKALGSAVSRGIVVTKYGHSMGEIGGLEIFEAGHPVPDENTVRATERVLEIVSDLGRSDTVLFLVSGGGSALFEKPADGLSLGELKEINDLLIRSGADIFEINAVRKRLSKVKGGRFAEFVRPAGIFALILSDVIGDRPDTIASGPAYPDSSTFEEAMETVEKYDLELPKRILDLLSRETPKELHNVETRIVGSVGTLCERASEISGELGYRAAILTTTLDCEAKEAGALIASIAREEASDGRPLKGPCALILGGETVVKVRGKGLGGRNQELALAAAIGIKDTAGVVVASIGTDGTDGPTDAAGGLVDGKTAERILNSGLNPYEMLLNNDSYHALEAGGALVKTGPTGTNVNDLVLILCR